MEGNAKDEKIIIRIQKERKDKWKKLCYSKKISLTSLIMNSVEDRILDDERRKILSFIEKQDNLFAKVETNINQIAKVANSQKFINREDFKIFIEQQKLIGELKLKQNEIFVKIYSLLANDH